MEDNSTLLYWSEQMLRYLRNELSEAEGQALLNWLEQNQDQKQFMDRLISESGFEDELAFFSSTDREQAWSQLQDKINHKRNIVRLWPRIAVAVAAVAAIVFGVWFYSHEVASSRRASRNDVVVNDIAPGKNGATITLANGKVIQLSDAKAGVVIGENLKYSDGTDVSSSLREGTTKQSPVMQMTASTAKGQTYQFTLPDGTHVWLNADSKLEFPSNFVNSKTRFVKLLGEAYFEVAKDKAHPFIVATDKQEVTVLGTHFNITAYSDEGSVRTTLLEGSVKVNDVILRPNQQSVLTDNNRINVKDVDVSEAVAWKNNEFMFESQSIESIMKMVERWYDVEVIYKGEKPVEKYSGSVSRFDNVSKVLQILEASGAVHFKIEGRKIYVSP